MADHDDAHGHEDHHDHDSGRSTAPQSAYTAPEVGVGAAIALLGIAIALVVPLVLTL